MKETRLKKNQVIARLEDNDIKAMLEESKASLNLYQADLKDAENNFNRVTKLLQTGSVSQQEYDQAQSKYNRVLASIEIARARVNAAEVALRKYAYQSSL